MNAQRRALSQWKGEDKLSYLSQAVREYVEQSDLSVKDIAEILGVSRTAVSNRIAPNGGAPLDPLNVQHQKLVQELAGVLKVDWKDIYEHAERLAMAAKPNRTLIEGLLAVLESDQSSKDQKHAAKHAILSLIA